MKIAILVYAHQDVGLGHYHRSTALASELRKRGHLVWILGNMMVHGEHYFQVRENNPVDLYHILEQVQPDILIADLQSEVPPYIYDMLSDSSRLVILNGVGRDHDVDAGMVFIQGLGESVDDRVYAGHEYVILRPELKKMNLDGPRKEWFVFGGAKDKMMLVPAFQHALPQANSNILMTPMSISLDQSYRTMYHELYIPASQNNQLEAFKAALTGTQKACIAMGMTAWEMAALGIPSYVFSATEGHLAFAKRMEDAGILKAWNGVGLPDEQTMRDFLAETPVQPKLRPDFNGASRVADRLEERYGK